VHTRTPPAWFVRGSVTFARVGDQPAERVTMSASSPCGGREGELRTETGGPVDARLLPVRVEMLKDVPGHDHVGESRVDAGRVTGVAELPESCSKRVERTGVAPAARVSVRQRQRHARLQPRSEVDIDVCACGRRRLEELCVRAW